MKLIILSIFCSISFLSYATPQSGEDQVNKRVEFTYTVNDIAVLSSKYSDFAPFVHGDKIYFTSNREINLVLAGENRWSKAGYYNVYYAELDMTGDSPKMKNPRPLPFKTNTDNHTGPICISPDGKEAFFTKVDSRPKVGNLKPKIYRAAFDGSNFSDFELLDFMEKEYTYGHPTLTNDGQKMFFSSDKDAKDGEKNLFYSKREGGKWTAPVKLDAIINTDGDEVFPFVREEYLYFSSNGHEGQGGLDIFRAKITDDGFEAPENLGEKFNSGKDDFGITFKPNKKGGYFSSNRNGKDDIFYFDFSEKIIVTKSVFGEFAYSKINKDTGEVEILLVDDDGEVIAKTTTSHLGEFAFENLPADKNYSVRLSEIEDDATVFITDDAGNILATYRSNKDGEFVFKKLSTDMTGTISMMNVEDEEMGFGKVSGQFVYEKLSGDYPEGMKVYLVDDEGNIIQTTTADSRGNFEFKELPTDKNYSIKAENELDEAMVLLVYDANENVKSQYKSDADGNFVFRKLKPENKGRFAMLDVEDDANILANTSNTVNGKFNYKKLDKDPSNITVQAYDDDGNLIASTKTDEKGNFRFTNLPVDQQVMFKVIDAEDEEMELSIYNRQGDEVAILVKSDDGYFIYKHLDADRDIAMVTDEAEDSEIAIKPNLDHIYFDVNSAVVPGNTKPMLNKLVDYMKAENNVKVDITGFASATGAKEYNLGLSKRRANSVKNYLVKKGVAASRIIADGKGQSNFLNHCKEGVECSDEEHKKNQRVEINWR